MVAQFPRGEADLRSQMRRASRSVPFNIGEGVGRKIGGNDDLGASYRPRRPASERLPTRPVTVTVTAHEQRARRWNGNVKTGLADRVAAMLTKLIRSAVAETG